MAKGARLMWVFTTDGFYSTVEDRNDKARLIVRSRAKADALNLIEWLGDHDFTSMAMQHTPDADYEWRLFIPRHAWAAYLMDVTKHLDYPNFKNAVAERQGSERADIYHDVWHVMWEFQEDNRE
jgi:hypothetical protein